MGLRYRCLKHLTLAGILSLLAISILYHQAFTTRVKKFTYLSRFCDRPSTSQTTQSPNPVKFINERTPEEEFERRRRRIQDVCTSHYDLPGTVDRVFKHEDSGVIYCFVPKSGCTFWKRVFNIVNNVTIKRTYQSVFSIPRLLVHTLDNAYGEDYRDDRYGPDVYPIRLLVTRDPISRILSSYLDKLYLPDFWENGVQFARMCKDLAQSRQMTIRKFQNFERLQQQMINGDNNFQNWSSLDNSSNKVLSTANSPKTGQVNDHSAFRDSTDFMRKHFDDMAAMFNSSFDPKTSSTFGDDTCGKYITFSEFVRAILFFPDSHWEPVHERCNPCRFLPSHVSYMETFTQDAKVVLDKMGLEGILDHFDNVAQIREELTMIVEYFFTRAFRSPLSEFYTKCVTPTEMAYRLWKNFQWRGYIHPEVRYSIPDFTEDLRVKEDLMTQIWKARKLGLEHPTAMHKAKTEFMRDLYSTLSTDLFEELMWKFRLDLKFFGHENIVEEMRRFIHR